MKPIPKIQLFLKPGSTMIKIKTPDQLVNSSDLEMNKM